MNIYLAHGSEEYGPYTLEEVHAHYRSNHLQDTYWVWCEGMEQWVSLADFIKSHPLAEETEDEDSQMIPVTTMPDPASRPRPGHIAEKLKKITDKLNFFRNMYVIQDEERYGPYSMKEVQHHYSQKAFRADALIWREGLDGWVNLRECLDYYHKHKTLAALQALRPEHPNVTPQDLKRITWKFGKINKPTNSGE